VPVRVIYGAQDILLPNIVDTMHRLRQDIPHAETTAHPPRGTSPKRTNPSTVGEALAPLFAVHDGGAQ
jgi:hypothetical protein